MTVELLVTPKSVDHIYELINVRNCSASSSVRKKKYSFTIRKFKETIKKSGKSFTKLGKKHMLVCNFSQ